MKKVLFLALILVASLQQADAQRRGGKGNTTPEQRVEQRMTKLSEELNLKKRSRRCILNSFKPKWKGKNGKAKWKS